MIINTKTGQIVATSKYDKKVGRKVGDYYKGGSSGSSSQQPVVEQPIVKASQSVTNSPFKQSRYEQIVSNAQNKSSATVKQQTESQRISNRLNELKNMSLTDEGYREKRSLERRAEQLASETWKYSTNEQKLGHVAQTASPFSARSFEFWASGNPFISKMFNLGTPQDVVQRNIAESITGSREAHKVAGYSVSEYEARQATDNPLTQFLVWRGAGQVATVLGHGALVTGSALGTYGSKVPVAGNFISKAYKGGGWLLNKAIKNPKSVRDIGVGLYGASESVIIGSQLYGGVNKRDIFTDWSKRTTGAVGFVSGVSSMFPKKISAKDVRVYSRSTKTADISHVSPTEQGSSFIGNAEGRSANVVRTLKGDKIIYTDTLGELDGRSTKESTTVVEAMRMKSYSYEPTKFNNLFGKYVRITRYPDKNILTVGGIKVVGKSGKGNIGLAYSKTLVGGKSTSISMITDKLISESKSVRAIESKFAGVFSGRYKGYGSGRIGTTMPVQSQGSSDSYSSGGSMFKLLKPDTSLKISQISPQLSKSNLYVGREAGKIVTKSFNSLIKPSMSFAGASLFGQMYGQKTKTNQGRRLKSNQQSGQRQNQDEFQKLISGQTSDTGQSQDIFQITAVTPVIDITQRTETQQIITPVPPTPTYHENFFEIPSFVPIGMPIMDAGMEFPFGFGNKNKGKRKRKYTPSLMAIGWNITGKRPKILTGAEIRPLKTKIKNPFSWR